MRKSIFFILLVIFSCTIEKSKKENHLRSFNFNLKGNIIQIEEITYEATVKFGEPFKTDNIYSKKEYIFNDLGYLLIQKDEFSTTSYAYDAKNNKIEETCTFPDGNQMYKFINKYGVNEKLIEVETFGADNKLTQKSKYEYEQNKRIVNTYDNDGNLESRWVDILNESKKVSHSYSYDKNGELTSEWEFSFDERGNKTQDILIKSLYPSEDNIEIKEFNENNELSKISFYDLNNKLISNFTLKYKYDDKDNWVYKTMFNKDGNAIQITERKIIYK